ncbi:MAG: DEAD/DEAH box helicase [Verrucomicrobia bacterium]|nr:DEAD/DEAH box helicase [Verrucomicrobiota bacterium]NDA26567.1 DEAD/DEAH box helicase [Verrucomicrobiota bacterium]
MKAIITNRIYMDDPGKLNSKFIIDSLTYKFKKNTGSKKFSVVETVKNYRILSKGIISIPQGRTDLIPDGYEIIDKRVTNPVPFPQTKYPLREDQLEVYNSANDTCFINALVGWGKTFTALHIAKKWEQKTLIVTHTTALRDQWCDEIKTLFNINPGTIGSGNYDIEDHCIVVGNVQSIIKHLDKINKEFGTVILDEAHHCPATTFSKTIDSFYARYRLALSGTIERKDGKHIFFSDYFGHTIFRPKQSNTIDPVVHIVKSNLTLKSGVTWVEKINELTQNDYYRKFISALATFHINQGHSVLIVADRIEFLEKVKEYVGETCLLVTGDTSYEERQYAKQQILSKEKMCIAGSRQIFSEGISINALSCVILAVPMSNDSLLEQIVGRIMREFPNKPQPIVVDIQFSGWADKKQNNDRLGLYVKKGWKIELV